MCICQSDVNISAIIYSDSNNSDINICSHSFIVGDSNHSDNNYNDSNYSDSNISDSNSSANNNRV